MATLILVNPKAGSGRALTQAQRLLRLVPESRLEVTRAPGHASELARQAQEAGIGTVVAVGGDGTIQEVVSGLCLDGQGRPLGNEVPRATLALLPAGTGGDYRRTFGMKDAVEQAASRILSPTLRRVDVGRAEFRSPGGDARALAFANVLSFGLGGLTDRLVESAPKWVGGTVAFYLGAVRATLVYEPVPVELTIDGVTLPVAAYSNVAVCIGRYFGGGMKIAPAADPSDGLFDIVTIEASRLGVISLTRDIYRGKHVERESVRVFRGRHVSARTTRPGETLLDLDGQQPGALPVEVTLLPSALTLAT